MLRILSIVYLLSKSIIRGIIDFYLKCCRISNVIWSESICMGIQC